MKDSKSNKTSGRHISLMLLLLGAIFSLGAISAWWFASRIQKSMRNDLLIQAQLVAGSIKIKDIQALTGTDADLTSPGYLQCKEMLASIRPGNPKCRFLYLIGRKEDGTVFFYADSEPAGSKDESPAGQLYDDIPPEYLQVFETKKGSVEGPATDRWGTWVTALAPIIDPETGGITAVLCMDIDARDWKWNVIARTSLPVGLILMVMVLAFLFVILRQRSSHLQINEQKYRYLFEGAAGGIAIIREDNIEFANPALAGIAGYPIEKITSMPFIDLIHPDDQMMVQNRHRRRMQGENAVTGYDFRVITKDGIVKWVNINSQLIQWEGAPANLAFITDITDRKQTEEKLATLYEETNLINRLMRDRENRMLELKKEVNRLSLQLNRGIVYKSVED